MSLGYSKIAIVIGWILFATFNCNVALGSNDWITENGTEIPVADVFVSIIEN